MTEISDNFIVIAGGTGFLGRALVPRLTAAGYRVVVLSRGARDMSGAEMRPWDGRTVGDWAACLDGAAAVINLAGRSVNCRYTRRNRAAILHSRVEATRAIGEAVARARRPPAVWLNASTATIYRHSLDRDMDEAGDIAPTPAAKDAFSVDVARAWEAALAAADTPATRKIALRAAMVLGRDPGGVLAVLARLARWGLGGAMAGGRQYVSWVHEEDFARAVLFLMNHKDLAGPVNVAAPAPVTNAHLMRVVRQAVGARAGLPAARWMLEVGAFFLRTETELVIKSRRVVPGRLTAAGFTFRYPEVEGAVRELLGRRG